MKDYSVRQYQKEDYSIWNSFVSESKNATFLFHRDFMEYHSDRFEDFSLLIFNNEKLVALIPANKVNNEIYSHQGLTFGGLLFLKYYGGEFVEELFNEVISFLKNKGFGSFFIKQTPIYYSEIGSLGVDYLLFQNDAQLYRRDMNLVIDYLKPMTISKSKMKHFNRIERLNLEIRDESDVVPFWDQVLIPRLRQKYDTSPVHSTKEMVYLKSKFSDNIKQFSVYSNDEIIAGITLFISKNGVKSQYGATTAKGESLRALDFLFISLIQKYKSEGKLFFDMGIVNDEKLYNKGLLKQKEELGCYIYNQDYYKLSLK